jgi:hypothetical protein
MSHEKDMVILMKDIDRLKHGLKNIRKELNKFKLFKTYTKKDYEDCVQNINEILGGYGI